MFPCLLNLGLVQDTLTSFVDSWIGFSHEYNQPTTLETFHHLPADTEKREAVVAAFKVCSYNLLHVIRAKVYHSMLGMHTVNPYPRPALVRIEHSNRERRHGRG